MNIKVKYASELPNVPKRKFILNLDRSYPHNKPLIVTTPEKEYIHKFNLTYQQYLSLEQQEVPCLIIWIHKLDKKYKIWRRVRRIIFDLKELKGNSIKKFDFGDGERLYVSFGESIQKSFIEQFKHLLDVNVSKRLLNHEAYTQPYEKLAVDKINKSFHTSKTPPVGLFYHVNCNGVKKTLLSPLLIDPKCVKTNESFWLNIYQNVKNQYTRLGMEINEKFVWAEVIMNLFNKTHAYYPDTHLGKHIESFWKKVADCEDFSIVFMVVEKCFEQLAKQSKNELFKRWYGVMKRYIPTMNVCTSPSPSRFNLKGHSFNFLFPRSFVKSNMKVFDASDKVVFDFLEDDDDDDGKDHLPALFIDSTEFVYYLPRMHMTKSFARQNYFYDNIRTGLLNIRSFYTIDQTSFYQKELMWATPYFYYKYFLGASQKDKRPPKIPFAFNCGDQFGNYGANVSDVFKMKKGSFFFTPQYFIGEDYIKRSEVESKFKITVPTMVYDSASGVFEKPYVGDAFYDSSQSPQKISLNAKEGKFLDKKKGGATGYGWLIPGELDNGRFKNKFEKITRNIDYTIEKEQFGFDSFSYFVKFFG